MVGSAAHLRGRSDQRARPGSAQRSLGCVAAAAPTLGCRLWLASASREGQTLAMKGAHDAHCKNHYSCMGVPLHACMLDIYPYA